MLDLPNLATCRKIGFIVPSSNTAVEPITSAIFQSLNTDIICLFTRIPVTIVGSDSASTSQFSTETMVTAAKLLADAHCHAILWNGTSGMWVGTGLEADQALAKAMEDATGIPCSTTTLATVDALRLRCTENIGLVVPYTEALSQKLADFFTKIGDGWKVSSVQRLEPVPVNNAAIAKSSMEEIGNIVRKCAIDLKSTSDITAIVLACTNLPAAGLVGEMEEAFNVVVLDSIIVTVWQGLRLAGFSGTVSGWGVLMEECLS